MKMSKMKHEQEKGTHPSALPEGLPRALESCTPRSPLAAKAKEPGPVLPGGRKALPQADGSGFTGTVGQSKKGGAAGFVKMRANTNISPQILVKREFEFEI